MSFTPYKTWTVTVVTLVDLNQQIRDNGNVLKTSIDNNGHIQWITATKTTTYTFTTADDIVFASGTFTISLPAAPVAGKPYRVKNTGTGTITVSGNGHTIDGASTFTVDGQYTALEFIYNGTEFSVF